MTPNPRRGLAIMLALLIAIALAPAWGEDPKPESSPEPLTIGDPAVPVDELALLLRPLTKPELLVEAEAWQALVRAKAEEIARAEIAVKRQNREIDKAAEIQDQAAEAKEQLEKVKDKAAEARASGDTGRIAETEEAAREAQEKVRAVREKVEEAAAAAEKTAEAKEGLSDETRAALDQTEKAADAAGEGLDRVRDAVEEVDTQDGKAVDATVDEVREATRSAEEATEEAARAADLAARGSEVAEQVEAAADTLAEAEDAKRDEKVALLERVNTLREERTQLIDRFKTVLDELESKTDKEDTDTLSKITDYRLYMTSVSGISLDVKDTTSAWVAIKGWLVSDEGGLRWLENILTFLGILLVAWFLSKVISRAVHRALRMSGKASRLLENFLVGAARWVVMIAGFLMALAALEVSVGPLLAVVGAAGFVVAFALQDSLSNFASGIMILFFRPFDEGDVIDAGGVSGKVIAMNLVSTTIKTFDNKDMVVPNNKIWHDVITNATGVATRRVDMEFGIAYDADVDQAQVILEEIVTGHAKVLKDPEPTIRLNTLADSSVNFICRPWTRTVDYWDVYWDVTREVKRRFDAAGIGIPFPQRDVHLYLADAGAKAQLSAGLRKKEGGANAQPFELEEDKGEGADA